MKRRLAGRVSLLCVWLAVCAVCVRGAEPQTAPDLFDEALSFSKELDPDTNLDDCRKAWKELVEQVRTDLDAEQKKAGDEKLNAADTVHVLNKDILVERKVSYISNKYWRDSLFTSALLKKQGNCLSTSLLYYLVARELKLPIRLVIVPRHAMVRWSDGKRAFNIETTAQGRAVDDADVLTHFDLSPEDIPVTDFLADLDDNQIRAHLLANWSGVLYSLDKREEAEKLLNQARNLCPENAYFRMQEAGYLMSAGQIEAAENMIKQFLEDAAGPWLKASAALAWANFLESRGKSGEAIDLLANHFETAPGHMKLEMIGHLGVLYRHQRNFPRAIAMHRLATKLDPDEHNYNDLGSVLTEAHKDADAIDAYEKALKCNPENFFTQVILAGLYERTGDREKGRACFAKIKEPRENKGVWYCALVWYYANIKEEDEMLKNMELALTRDGSGHVYQYFVREPDLDPYRKNERFDALMKKFAPQESAEPVEHK